MATQIHTDTPAAATHVPCCGPTLESLERTIDTARRVVTEATHATADIAHDTAERVRRHPLPAVTLAAAAGILAGGLAAITLVALQRRR
jgi:hypothetical protein